jgi:hypothetical protein
MGDHAASSVRPLLQLATAASSTARNFFTLTAVQSTAREYYVRVVDGDFVTGDGPGGTCRRFFPAGFNKFEMVEAGAGAPVLFDGKLEEAGLTGPAVVRRVLNDARNAGLNMLRMNAFAVDRQ